MTVFKTFLKILNKNKFIVILYTVILLTFGGFNMQTSDKGLSYTPEKPSITIVNEDENTGITKSLINYIKKNSKDPKIKEDNLDDALFYGDTNYIIYIPKNYHNDIMNKDIELEIKKSSNYNSEFADMLLKRYLKLLNIYKDSISDEEKLVTVIDKTLEENVSVEFKSQIDNKLNRVAFYFNFESYSLLACLIYVICTIFSVFNNINIRKKNIISSTNYKKINRILLLSNILYALVLWLFYLIVSVILLGNIIFSTYGLIYSINSFVFTLCATTIAFLIGSIVTNKNAISGIVNVVALGSSFLCGAFVPMEYLPDSVLNMAKVFPTYYYIKNNEILKNIVEFNNENIEPIIINMIVMIVFMVLFIVITNIISKRKRKIG